MRRAASRSARDGSHRRPAIRGLSCGAGRWRILLVSWVLYPVASVIPAIFPTDDWIVVRQICYTVADITSKLVFGIVLARAALMMRAEEGYEEAIETRSPDRVREHV